MKTQFTIKLGGHDKMVVEANPHEDRVHLEIEDYDSDKLIHLDLWKATALREALDQAIKQLVLSDCT